MTLSLEQLSARMRQGEDIPLSDTARIALALSIPSILEQLVVTAMEYIDAAMVGHIGAEATAAIGIVSSSTWLLHGILVGLYTAFSIQIAQYLGADRQQDARGVLRQSMLFNLILGLGAAAFGVGISRFLPGWLGADISLQASSSAYFAIWSAALPFTMAMGMYSAMLRATGDALTPGLISVLVCALDVVFNFFLINPTRQIQLFGQSVTVWGAGLEVPGAALGTALSTAIGGLLALGVLLLRDGPLCIRKPGSWRITSACLRNLWRVGTPLAAERAALSSAQVLLVRIVSGLGTVAIAANSLGVSAEGLCYMAGYGIQDASIALIGQAVGAHRRDMAKRFAWLCTMMGIGIMALSGVGLCLTTFQIERDRVTLLRVGEVNSQMVFEEGRRHLSMYDTPYGALSVGINTRKMRAELDARGGNIEIDYAIEIDHALAGQNLFRIHVREKGPAIKQ